MHLGTQLLKTPIVAETSITSSGGEILNRFLLFRTPMQDVRKAISDLFLGWNLTESEDTLGCSEPVQAEDQGEIHQTL